MDDYIVFFDLETTGLNYKEGRVIQIAAAATTGFPQLEVVDHFEAKLVVDPKYLRKLWKGSNYDTQIWEDEALSPHEAWVSFFEFTKPYRTVSRKNYYGGWAKVAQLAGHNAATFDRNWLWHEAKDIHKLTPPVSGNVFDTMQLALFVQMLGRIDVPNIQLGTLAEAAGCPLGADAHDALADINATVQVTRWLLGKLAR